MINDWIDALNFSCSLSLRFHDGLPLAKQMKGTHLLLRWPTNHISYICVLYIYWKRFEIAKWRSLGFLIIYQYCVWYRIRPRFRLKTQLYVVNIHDRLEISSLPSNEIRKTHTIYEFNSTIFTHRRASTQKFSRGVNH